MRGPALLRPRLPLHLKGLWSWAMSSTSISSATSVTGRRKCQAEVRRSACTIGAHQGRAAGDTEPRRRAPTAAHEGKRIERTPDEPEGGGGRSPRGRLSGAYRDRSRQCRTDMRRGIAVQRRGWSGACWRSRSRRRRSDAACTDTPQPGVDWRRCLLDNRNFVGVDLAGATLRDGFFARSDLTRVGLQRRSMHGAPSSPTAVLVDTRWSGARLIGTDFTKSDLTGAVVRGRRSQARPLLPRRPAVAPTSPAPGWTGPTSSRRT